MRSRALLPLIAVLALAACDEKILVVESNTSWEGTITYAGDVSGTGSATVDLSDFPSNVCWTLRKTTTDGVLRAYLKDETWFGLGEEIDGDQTTSEPNGEVSGCNE